MCMCVERERERESCTSPLLQACMFVNVSPLTDNMAETISSLEFGTNTRQVELGKATKHISKPH